MSEEKIDKGWEYLCSDAEEGSFFDDDGSWWSQDADGSGSYFGADGSWGSKDSDGSASFFGADGSWGTRYSDGSVSYYGNDGTWGYKNSDGSGAYYSGSNSEDIYYDANADDYNYDDATDDESSYGLSDLFVDAIDAAVKIGTIKYSQKREKERQEEAAKQAEAERIRLEKEKERNARKALRRKRTKAFLFKGKKVEVSYGSRELVGKNIDYVTRVLSECAFTNIKTTSVKDIYIGSKYKVGQVEQITIGGSSYFEKGDQIPYDADIAIRYHEKREIMIPFSERSLRRMNYATVGDKLEELGFTEIYEHPIRDLVTGWIKKDGAVEKVTIGEIYPFKKNSIFTYDTKIVIEYHTFKKKQ